MLSSRQVKHDEIDIGDEVWVQRRRYGSHPGGNLRGKVEKMARGRAIVKMANTGMCMPVDLKFMSLTDECAQKKGFYKLAPKSELTVPVAAFAPELAKKVAPEAPPPQPVAAKPEPEVKPPAPAAVPAPEPEPQTLQIDKMMRERKAADDELTAWLEMGRQLLPNLRAAAEASKAAEDEASREIERLMAARADAAREYNSTMARIRRLEPLVG